MLMLILFLCEVKRGSFLVGIETDPLVAGTVTCALAGYSKLYCHKFSLAILSIHPVNTPPLNPADQVWPSLSCLSFSLMLLQGFIAQKEEEGRGDEGGSGDEECVDAAFNCDPSIEPFTVKHAGA